MIEMQERFFRLIDNAVALNLEMQLEVEETKPYMAQGHWLQEHGTVSIDVGRQMGKTRYIRERMRPCDLVIVHSYVMADDYNRAAQQKLDNVVPVMSVLDRIGMVGAWRGRKIEPVYFNKVYIDEPSFTLSAKFTKQTLFEWLGGRCNQVIMLGTPLSFNLR